MLPPPLPRQLEVLRRVQDRVAVLGSDGGAPPVVVFGLDGTLFDPRTRTLHILSELAEAMREDMPEVASALERLRTDDVQTLLGDTLRSVGIDRPAIVNRITHYYRSKYFDESYLELDQPCPGASEYVWRLWEAGAIIVYVGGRDVPGMLVGTVASLREHGFPFAQVGVQLVLKRDATLGDDSFLRDAIPTLARAGEVVALFDAAPMICTLARQTFPNADIGLVDHWPPDPYDAIPGVERIHDFRLS